MPYEKIGEWKMLNPKIRVLTIFYKENHYIELAGKLYTIY